MLTVEKVKADEIPAADPKEKQTLNRDKIKVFLPS
jgi:hypothetical protein